VVFGPVRGVHEFDRADVRLLGEPNAGQTGASLAALGDLDRDGYDDLGVGAVYVGDGAHPDDRYLGAVYVVRGGPR
jgi:hypothetical protein